MTKWTMCGTGLALLVGGATQLSAQIPAAPAAPAVPPLVAPAAPAAPATPSNLWSFLLPNKDQIAGLQGCKEKICASQIGQLLNNSLAPVGAFTGGLLGPCCPAFKQDDLKKPSDSVDGAAAKIKADEADAKARVANVKYLARVDCAYWPEAADALVNALRADKNECVRLAAAQALGTGCCCGKKTIVALSIAAAASDRDGNPAEKSDRVRFAAQASLENCLARCGCAVPVPTAPVREGPAPTEGPSPIKPVSATEATGGKSVDSAAYYKRVESLTSAQIAETVQQSAMTWKEPATQISAAGDMNVAMAATPTHSADHSLFGVVASAVGPAKSMLAPPGRQTPPTAHAAVVKATETTAETTYQPKTIQTVLYQAPTTRAWQPGAEAKPAAPAYKLPVVQPAQPATLPQASSPPNHFPPANGLDVGHMLKVLREGSHAEQRAWAAGELATVDGRGNPDVVDALVAAGQIDASAGVRLQCVRTLVKMNAGGTAVRELFEALQNDADGQVQKEARKALGTTKS